MWMPGYLIRVLLTENSTEEERRAAVLPEARWGEGDELPYFVAVVKGHIATERLNEFIDFPPIIKKLEIKSDRQTLGDFMYTHILRHELPKDKKETKLTQLLSTHDRFMSFGMYELWGLIDDCGFVMDAVSCVLLFTKHDKIGKFVNYFFNKRVSAKTKGENALCKSILNSSYGADGMNNEKFKDVKFMSKEKALRATSQSNFFSESKINDDVYHVEREPESAACKKPLQTAYATLSNAKYWFIRFVYGFMYKCLERSRFHFCCCDTDSYMWAVAGTGEREKLLRERILLSLTEKGKEKIMKKIVPHFEEIIVDKEFYYANYPLWFPRKKTLMTLEYEHCCYNLIALAPKNYWTDDGVSQIVKTKGVSVRGELNKHINGQAFKACVEEGAIIGAENYVLRTKEHKMTKQILKKTGLSGVVTKSVVLENQACVPFIYGISADKYHIT
jgi:hypothetical protein